MSNETILILGANGMAGRTVYAYLSKRYKNVFGSVRNKNSIFFNLKAETLLNDFEEIQKKIKPTFVINCIAVTNKNGARRRFALINSKLPKELEKLTKKYNFKLIHLSTDGVFDPSSLNVTEKKSPNAKDPYGKSKILGEVSSDNSITIRSSLVGFNPNDDKVLFEWFIKNKKKEIKGYTNQNWSGATSLQIAKLTEFMISEKNFDKLRIRSHVYHFAPLGPFTKYNLLNSLKRVTLKKITVIKNKSDNRIIRYLSSVYFDKNFLSKYTSNIDKALRESIEFEKHI